MIGVHRLRIATGYIGALALACPIPALADAQIKTRINWSSAADKPTAVVFQTSAEGEVRFTSAADHYQGERSYPRAAAAENFVVRWGGTSTVFRARAQADAKLFSFRVSKPDITKFCNDDNVLALRVRANTADMDVRIASMQDAAAMLARTTEKCTDSNRRILSRLAFNLNCVLAKETKFFDISPDVASSYLTAFGNAEGVAVAIRKCRSAISGQVVGASYSAGARERDSGDISSFLSLTNELLELYDTGDFSEGFYAADVTLLDLQHRKIEALNRQFEAYKTDSATALAAAKELDALSRDDAYIDAFGAAQLDVNTARLFPATVENWKQQQLESRMFLRPGDTSTSAPTAFDRGAILTSPDALDATLLRRGAMETSVNTGGQ